MRRTRGFTLIEIMVALALAGLVVAGAIQLHVAFNRQAGRQQEISEMQQSLRVAMQVLERAIRTAGQGLPATHTVTGFSASCAPTVYYDFQFSNSNAYSDPQTTFWNPATQDTDPDWFRVIASDSVGDYGVTLASTATATQMKILADGAQNWAAGDLLAIIPDTSYTSATTTMSLAATACQIPYQLTAAYLGTPTQAVPGTLTTATTSCYNQVAHNPCLSSLLSPPISFPSLSGLPVRHIPAGGTVYRIMPASEQGTSPQLTPKLTMRSAPFGTPLADPTYSWNVIADNIEDMQIAVILGDGTVCINKDAPAACPFATASAVRVTLVARSSMPLQGAPLSPTGGYEDEPTVTPATPDNFLRRSMTATIVLRNITQ